jgi:hypothetical protein
MNDDRYQFASFVAALGTTVKPRHRAPVRLAHLACELVKLARIIERVSIAECSDADISERTRTIGRKASGAIHQLCREYGIGEPTIGGDPRGYTVKLPLQCNGRPMGNTWGGDSEGWGIPLKS